MRPFLRTHEPCLRQFFNFVDVHRAPNTAGFARCDPDAPALGIDRFAAAVDPAKTQHLIDKFRPRHVFLFRAFFVQADDEFGLFVVVLFEPVSKVVLVFEEKWFQIMINVVKS